MSGAIQYNAEGYYTESLRSIRLIDRRRRDRKRIEIRSPDRPPPAAAYRGVSAEPNAEIP